MVTRSGLGSWIARGEAALRASTQKPGEARAEHPVVGSVGSRCVPVRSVGRHEGLHVRKVCEAKSERQSTWLVC
jgi:hypothetical protein